MNNSVLLLILWGIGGIMVLTGQEVSKLEYGLCWITLMMYAIDDVIQKIG